MIGGKPIVRRMSENWRKVMRCEWSWIVVERAAYFGERNRYYARQNAAFEQNMPLVNGGAQEVYDHHEQWNDDQVFCCVDEGYGLS